jgi:uncharacterized membrane protein YdjX (TVP38/TMEM64 family)
MSAGTRLALLAAALLAVLLSSFLLVEAIGVTLLDDPITSLEGGGAGAALLGVSLLVADAVLPVPSSLVMISLGALYGAFLGTLLALVGRFGMAIVGLALGRAGAPIVVKLIGDARRVHAEGLVERWGAFAIIVSRPVPLLAEAVVLSAGAARLPWRVALPAAFVGSIPEAVAYGLLGATAASAKNGALVWLAFLVVGTLFRLGELAHRRSTRGADVPAAASS